MSALTIRPRGPLPSSAARSRPAWLAIRLASGLAKMRPESAPLPARAAGLAGACSCAAAGGSAAGSFADGSSFVAGAEASAFAGASALKPSSAELSSPSSRIRPITVLTGTPSAPSATTILPSVPSSIASTSMVALSVSISAITSPAEMWSPSFLSQRARLPSVMVGDRAGIRSSIGIAFPRALLASAPELRLSQR